MTLRPDQLSALNELEQHFQLPVVVIGATALGFYFDMSWRATADLDLVVAVELESFPSGLQNRPGWQQDRRKPYEFRAPSGSLVDILPAGPRQLETGKLAWPGGYVMNLAGLDLAFRHGEPRLVRDHSVVVAPPHVVVVLKMVSYLDRPAERERDLSDIGYVLDAYVPDDDDRRWQDTLPPIDFDLVSAHVLGTDVGLVCGPQHRQLVQQFLDRVGPLERWEHGLMERRGPPRWRTEDEPLARRLSAFREAFDARVAAD